MKRLAVVLAPAVVVAGAAAACTSPNGDPDPGDAGRVPPHAEIGTGERAFEPIADGQELEYIRGAQGGYHFIGSVRARGIDPGDPLDRRHPGNPTTSIRVLRDGERIDFGPSWFQGLSPADGLDGTFEMVGRLVILDIATCDELDGVTVDVELTITDVHGARADDRRTVTAVPHPINSMTGGG